MPDGTRSIVSESGIRGPDDVARLGEAGVDAILVGESLLKAAGARAGRTGLMSTLRATRACPWLTSARVKVCGVTRREDALAIDRAGALTTSGVILVGRLLQERAIPKRLAPAHRRRT